MKAEDPTLSNYDIADRFDISEASVRRALRRPEAQPLVQIAAEKQQQWEIALEQPIVFELDDGPLAITADWHIPITRWDIVNHFLADAYELGAKRLVVVGDWWNQDSLSRFDFKQESAGLDFELEIGEAALRTVLQQFDEVVMTWGNHDARLHKMMGYKTEFASAMRMMFPGIEPELWDRVRVSNLDHAWVFPPYTGSREASWYLCHPKTYNRQPLYTARQLASKFLANIMTGHSHHTAIGHDVSGQFVLAELGGFMDTNKTQYLQRTTTFPTWQTGYSFLDENGRLFMEGEGWSVGRLGR